MRRYLCYYAHDHLDFRLPELNAVASLAGINTLTVVDEYDHRECKLSPFFLVDLPSEACAVNMAARSILMKSVYELWGFGSTFGALVNSLREFPSARTDTFCRPDSSFKILVETFCKKVPLSYKVQLIDKLKFLPLRGKLQLTKPDHVFCLFQDYGCDPNSAPSDPYRWFFGRLVVHSQREIVDQYSVKKRHFIGNTSMDAQLTFLMANQAKVQKHQLVCDPFVGTGSILIACAHFGAHVVGTDIDSRILRGTGKSSRAGENRTRGPDENLRSNLRQYNLESKYGDVLIADFAQNTWTCRPLFDAIVTDPPYGIREGAWKIGCRKGEAYAIPEHLRDGHIPSRKLYPLSEVLSDLLLFAAHCLVLHGRLVYWLPVYRADYQPNLIPTHPCLTLITNSEQVLSKDTSRRLLTMEKTNEPTPETHLCESLQNKWYDSFRTNYFARQRMKSDRARETSSSSVS
ncbi:tRNA (guanine(10)-N2)-methyltransferase homolog isoform X2 [Corticium candelabrum]|nr:tRNA (guanine(10)-N2)-methyltransferase homolog isoform X2 [Corticium candelabrum]